MGCDIVLFPDHYLCIYFEREMLTFLVDFNCKA